MVPASRGFIANLYRPGSATGHNVSVAEQRENREERTDANRAVPPPPMKQDKQGWRVAPAPDGRGMPEHEKPRPPHRWRGFWIFVLVLLALNWFSVLVAQPGSQPRVSVPFCPYFLQQVESGKV